MQSSDAYIFANFSQIAERKHRRARHDQARETARVSRWVFLGLCRAATWPLRRLAVLPRRVSAGNAASR